jgi:alanine dehydrogenase
MIRKDQIVLTYLHLAAAEELTHALMERQSINIAYETIQKNDGSLPLLTPMSEVAGRMATQQGMFNDNYNRRFQFQYTHR